MYPSGVLTATTSPGASPKELPIAAAFKHTDSAGSATNFGGPVVPEVQMTKPSSRGPNRLRVVPFFWEPGWIGKSSASTPAGRNQRTKSATCSSGMLPRRTTGTHRARQHASTLTSVFNGSSWRTITRTGPPLSAGGKLIAMASTCSASLPNVHELPPCSMTATSLRWACTRSRRYSQITVTFSYRHILPLNGTAADTLLIGDHATIAQSPAWRTARQADSLLTSPPAPTLERSEPLATARSIRMFSGPASMAL